MRESKTKGKQSQRREVECGVWRREERGRWQRLNGKRSGGESKG